MRPTAGGASGSRGSTGGPGATAQSSVAATRAATLAGLRNGAGRPGGAPAPTAAGRAIARDLEALQDEYFETPAPGARVAPPFAAPAGAVRRAVALPAGPGAAQGGSDWTDGSGGGGGAPVRTSALSKEETRLTRIQSKAWFKGPAVAEGRVVDASGRNVLCMDVLGSMCVVGSADHGLKVVDLASAKIKRDLFTKKCGHTEWVTACAFAPDGRVLSGGMDSKLCLWHATAVRCDDLLSHTASVSQVAVNAQCHAVSASYDRTLKIWDLGGGGGGKAAVRATLKAHADAVMHFAWQGTALMSGDRKGRVCVWDMERAEAVVNVATNGGQVGALSFLMDDDMSLAMVGDQTGTLSVFDFRVGGGADGARPVAQKLLHRGGVLSGVRQTTMASGVPNYVVTAGADKVVKVLDPRTGFDAVHTWTDHRDFIYSLECFGPLVLSGAGNGWLLVHDATSGKCLYGLGANEAAVRNIFASQERLVASGDDGKVVIYDMN